MKKSKLLIIYGTLSERRRLRFGEFVRSPVHNKRKKLINLIALLEKEQGNTLDKEKAHGELFQGDYNELQINNLISDLYKLLEKFLAWEQMEKNTGQNDVLVIEHLMSQAERKGAGKMIRQKIRKEKPQDAVSYFRLNQLADQFYFQQSRKADNSFLIKSQSSLDIYYLSHQLRIWCELLSRANILGLPYDAEKFNLFIQFLDKNLLLYGNEPMIRIYYPILKWLKDQHDDTWYEGFRSVLFQHIEEFPENEARDIVSYIQNYCVKRINEGRTFFLTEWLEISKFMLPLHLLHEGRYLSQWTYKNIIAAGTRTGDFEWTENFIHSYYNELPGDERDNAYHYNLAVFYYERRDIDRAMQLLNKVHFTDPNYYLDAKSVLLKIYYDHHAYEPLLSLADSVKIYLMRHKRLSRSQQLLYKKLFFFTVRLYKLRLEKNRISPEKWMQHLQSVQQEIASGIPIANKQWLQQKVNELLAGQ